MLQQKFALRERSDGQVRFGWENDYPKCGGWKEVIGVPASYQHTTRLDYKDTLAEREAIKAIKHKVIICENKEWARKHNENLYWDELNRQYDKHNVNPKFRKQRPVPECAVDTLHFFNLLALHSSIHYMLKPIS